MNTSRKRPDGRASTHYFDSHFQRPAVKLHPGEYYVSRGEHVLVTVLGSCVAACIRDPVAGVSGMNHFLLPDTSRDDGPGMARYGVHAMEVLINGLLSRGGQRRRLEVKLFGGANLMRATTVQNVGHNNARFAREFMQREGLKVVSQDLFGGDPRKIWYFPDTGKVMLRRLTIVRNDTILRREIDYSRALVESPSHAGDVELFE